MTRPTPARGPRLAPDARRRQIVEATVSCLARHGPQQWTLRQVARDLGVAPSLITYFFASWSELLAAAYRMLSDRFAAEQRVIADRPGLTPAARLDALVDHYFSDYWLSDEVAGAYIAFWSLTRSEVDLRGEMSRFSASMRDALAPHVAARAAGTGRDSDTGRVADTLAVLLSGLWYEMAVNPDAMPRERALSMVRDYLDTALAPLPGTP